MSHERPWWSEASLEQKLSAQTRKPHDEGHHCPTCRRPSNGSSLRRVLASISIGSIKWGLVWGAKNNVPASVSVAYNITAWDGKSKTFVSRKKKEINK